MLLHINGTVVMPLIGWWLNNTRTGEYVRSSYLVGGRRCLSEHRGGRQGAECDRV